MRSVIEEILNTRLRHLRNNCPVDITDIVFLEIEKSYMDRYESAVNYKGADTINKFIGKLVREYWDLRNLGRCNHPRSKLHILDMKNTVIVKGNQIICWKKNKQKIADNSPENGPIADIANMKLIEEKMLPTGSYERISNKQQISFYP